MPFGFESAREGDQMLALNWVHCGGLVYVNRGAPKHWVRNGIVASTLAWGGKKWSNRIHYDWWMQRCANYDLRLYGKQRLEYLPDPGGPVRVRGERLDPADAYDGEWIGDTTSSDAAMLLGGTGDVIVGIHGTTLPELASLGLVLASAVRASPPPTEVVRLIDLTPERGDVGWDRLWVNWAMPYHFPRVRPDFQFCHEYLYAHAPSRLVYDIPAIARSFTAVGSCVVSADVRYIVRADGRELFRSPRAGVAPIRVDLPLGARQLELRVDDLGDHGADHSYWLLPRFHEQPADEVDLAGIAPCVKLTAMVPREQKVGAGEFLVNRPFRTPPVQLLDDAVCDEFLFAHAFSHLTYRVPEGAEVFSAIGYCVFSQGVRFRVFADGQLLFVSPQAGIVPIHVRLPAGARRLDLLIEDGGDGAADHSFWCYPRLHGTFRSPPPRRDWGRPSGDKGMGTREWNRWKVGGEGRSRQRLSCPYSPHSLVLIPLSLRLPLLVRQHPVHGRGARVARGTGVDRQVRFSAPAVR